MQHPDETLENMFETLKTRHHRKRPTWWGSAIGSKRRSGVVKREDGDKRSAGRGGECPDGACDVAVHDIIMLHKITFDDAVGKLNVCRGD